MNNESPVQKKSLNMQRNPGFLIQELAVLRCCYRCSDPVDRVYSSAQKYQHRRTPMSVPFTSPLLTHYMNISSSRISPPSDSGNVQTVVSMNMIAQIVCVHMHMYVLYTTSHPWQQEASIRKSGSLYIHIGRKGSRALQLLTHTYLHPLPSETNLFRVC
jgi:hypothetical protein